MKTIVLQKANKGFSEVSRSDATLLPLAFLAKTSRTPTPPNDGVGLCINSARPCLNSQSPWSSNTKVLNSPPPGEDANYCFKQSKEIDGE